MKARSAPGAELRILRRLSIRGARLVRRDDGSYVAESIGHRTSGERAAAAVVAGFLARGIVSGDADGNLILTDSGRALLRRSLAGGDADFRAQHHDLASVVLVDDDGAPRQVRVNQDESPLSWLRRRRGRDGRPLVGAPEFAAGERLRADYARARIMPRVTANWTATVAGHRRDGGSSGVAEMTEVVIAARRRVERALDAVGPELAGLMVDFCCFLKGLEEIERERRWPARSAKIVLRLGLAALARHYGLATQARGRDRSKAMLHWGTEDYRPAIE